LFEILESTDSVSTAQGLLLLTHYTCEGSGKENTYWLQLAIHFAREAGAHEYNIKKQLSRRHQNTLKRLWWCCIVRDRIISLGLRRPLQISSDDFDITVPGLQAQDFDDEAGCLELYDPTTKVGLIAIFTSLCDLAVSLTDIIMTIFPRKRRSNLPEISDIPQTYTFIGKATMDLDIWFVKTNETLATLSDVNDTHKSLKLYSNLLYIYY
jgi:hypothetical protein